MDRTVRDLARWWSWRRQRLDRSCRGVEDCLQSVIGVYSANPSGPLSLLARVPRLMKGAAVEGVISTKRAIRIPAMRRSVYMVPAANAHLIYRATQPARSPFTWLLGRHGISEKEYARLREAILHTAGTPKTSEEIRAGVARPPKDLTPVLQAACFDGVLLRIKTGSLRANDFSYCATESWLGEPLRQADSDEALVWLAGDYLTGFGPASAEDFAWWAGVPLGRAATALHAHDPVDVGGGLFLHARDVRTFEWTRPHLGRVSLLPKWDCYTMGYATDSRERFVSPSLLPHVYDAGGDAKPMILVEGEVQGTWSIRFARNRASISLDMFDSPGARLRDALDAEAQMAGTFLEATEVTVTRTKAIRPRAAGVPAPRSPAKGPSAAARKRRS